MQVVRERVAALVKPSKIGPAVDLDVLLLLLLHEHAGGRCPVAPLLHPRRTTDGRLGPLPGLAPAQAAAARALSGVATLTMNSKLICLLQVLCAFLADLFLMSGSVLSERDAMMKGCGAVCRGRSRGVSQRAALM
jgi:predicted CDP-diglyceride synthetase/phosphatidate cytidylyltransferase